MGQPRVIQGGWICEKQPPEAGPWQAPQVRIDGVLYRRAVSGVGEYMTAAGPVKVLRQRYRAAGANGASECPLELRAGIVEGFFTPLAARMGLWVLPHLTPAEAEQLFHELGGMSASRSSLDRLPKALSEKWEERRAQWEEQLRGQEPPPTKAAMLAVSLDGVMAPMKDGARQDKREHSRQQGKPTRGPAGFREVGCGTLSHYDGAGERLRTLRHARLPEPGKRTLKRQLVAEVEHALKRQPQLRLVKVADGARDNWEFLAKELPPGEEVVNSTTPPNICGVPSARSMGRPPPRRRRASRNTAICCSRPRTAWAAIRTLAYHHGRERRCKALKQELEYFRRNRARMEHARLRARNLPIGSGVVEAACKTLVTRRH